MLRSRASSAFTRAGARLGSVADDPVMAAAVARAAQLQALAEAASARALRADPKVTLDDVVRLNRLADHAVRALRLNRHNVKRVPTLSEYLAQHHSDEDDGKGDPNDGV
jgi:histidinol-phosphate/aromatic aminotransferase/cobyric acid decarboxylase-like protein